MTHGLAAEAPPVSQFNWRIVRKDEAAMTHALHCEVVAGLAAGLARRDDLAHFIRHIEDDGMIVGCFTGDGCMVAYGVLSIASSTASHIAELLDVDAADRARFAVLDGVAALTVWRGYGMHRASIRERLHHAQALGRTLIGVTAAPGNAPSIRGLLDADFRIASFAHIYNGLPRLVFKRDLNVPKRAWSTERKIAATDIAQHQTALAEGMTGFASSLAGDGALQVHYGYAQN